MMCKFGDGPNNKGNLPFFQLIAVTARHGTCCTTHIPHSLQTRALWCKTVGLPLYVSPESSAAYGMGSSGIPPWLLVFPANVVHCIFWGKPVVSKASEMQWTLPWHVLTFYATKQQSINSHMYLKDTCCDSRAKLRSNVTLVQDQPQKSTLSIKITYTKSVTAHCTKMVQNNSQQV